GVKPVARLGRPALRSCGPWGPKTCPPWRATPAGISRGRSRSSSPGPAPDMAGESIVLVDDDRVIQRMVGAFLERSGYNVRVASNGIDALKLVHERTPDIVLTDSRMPELNGIELTSRLRGHYRTAGMPIIMFSELTQVEDALVGYSAGADEYLPKPFEL